MADFQIDTDSAAGSSAVTLAVDPILEEAQLDNVGTTAVDLTGWRLLSVRGSQEFFFSGVQLGPQESVVIISRPGAVAGTGELPWSSPPKRVWHNGDPGELYDADGQLVAQSTSDSNSGLP